MSTNQILIGLGLTIVLALGCDLIATRTRLPAIVLLLPVGFIAGAATTDVHPDALFGDTFQPLVSLGVGLILFEAGLRLRLDELHGGTRRVVLRLIAIGIVTTLTGVTLASRLLFGIGWGSAVVLGAILVVSGPTVVMPLLEFVRPPERVRATLKWEGVLVDPLGALLGVGTFTVVRAFAHGEQAYHPGELIVSLGAGLVLGALGAFVLRLLLGGIQRAVPRQSVAAALMTVTAAVVVADLIHTDSGYVAATVMGAALANQQRLDLSRVLEFQGTVVRLLIGILFVLISASVSPSTVKSLLPGGIALLAIMVFVLRPLTVLLATRGSTLRRPERAFIAWLGPRGIVAAATASAFGPTLAQAGIPGANKILPIAFIIIFGTVAIYGLSATPVARRLGLLAADSLVVLIVGGHEWARAIASALKEAGLRVRVWTGHEAEQAQARESGLDAGHGRLGVDFAAREAELEEVTDALLMTPSDNFNALAAYELRQELGNEHVFRLPPSTELIDLVPAYAEGELMFGPDLTYGALERRFAGGARIIAEARRDHDQRAVPSSRARLLAVVSAKGELRVATSAEAPNPAPNDTGIWLV